MSDPSQLAERLDAAVRAWTARSSIAEFWHNWRGTGDGKKPAESCVALVQYARRVLQNARAGGVERDFRLEVALLLLESNDHESSAAWLFPSRNPTKETAERTKALAVRRGQVAHLVQGLVNVVRAAVEHTCGNQDASFEAIRRAAAHYDAAWVLTDVRVPQPKSGGSDLFADHRATALLQYAHADGAFGEPGITTSTWLILEDLLRVLLNDSEPSPLFRNQAKMLFYGSDSKGYVELMDVQSFHASQPGLLLDPLAFGPTYLDEHMQQSLRIAFRCCRQSFLARQNERSSLPTIRMIPRLPLFVRELSGPSAGGLFAAAMVSTAREQRLDLRRSATVALNLKSKSIDDLTPLEPGDVQLMPVGGVFPKLAAAAAVRHSLVEVALHERDHQLWKQHNPHLERPAVGEVSTLSELLEALRGDERFEEQLDRHCEAVADEWRRLQRVNESDPLWDEVDEHRFDHYVWPTYRIEEPQPSHQKPVDGEPDSKPVPGAEEERLRHLLEQLHSGHKNLVIYDKAGAGKTVFSWRMRQVAASMAAKERLFHGRPRLVVRFHGEWPKREGQPLPVLEAMLTEPSLKKTVPDDTLRAECVRYALDQRRVIIILDGFDQFSPAEREHVADLLKPDSPSGADARNGCRWIITSRVHTIDELRGTLFDDRRWTRVRIDPFTPEQQDKYFEDIDERWQETVPNREDVSDLLGLPLVLRMIRRLVEETPEGEPLPVSHTLGELFLKVARMLLERALLKSRAPLEEALRKAGLAHLALEQDERLALLERVLSLLSFQMLLDENYNGIIPGEGRQLRERIASYLERAKDRYFHDWDAALDQTSLPRRKQLDLESQVEIQGQHWNWAVCVLRTIELNHRAVTEAMQPERIAFRSRKIVECYAARYLTCYANKWDVYGSDDDGNGGEARVPCSWDFTGDHNDWHECWKLAIEMPPEERDDAVTARAIDVLFRPPRRGLRPTELMFRAWQMMQRSDFPQRRKIEILGTYRQQFLEILGGDDREQARIAAEVIREQDLRALAEAGKLGRWTFEDLRPAHPVYVRCCNEEDDQQLTFWMGTADGAKHSYGDEKPRHHVQVDAFEMAACAVTRAQYRLFDPRLEQEHADRFTDMSPDDDCPVIDTNWYDGFCFALWLGDKYSLPTETEWEGAARGRRDGPDDVIGIPPYDDTFTADQVNFEGNQPLSGDKSRFLQRTLPVRWDEARRAKAAREGAAIAAVPVYDSNAFGIWQAHGNVDEWCLSEWIDQLYRERMQGTPADKVCYVSVDDVLGSAASAGRVVRGGAWGGDAVGCRSADRYRGDPDDRSGSLGFRLCCRAVSVSPESSSLR